MSKGRETLERAIKLVEATEKWRAKVVYGDTDSLFVLVPGRSRADAFKIGAEIADAVTNDNPYPVKLKLEKVYQPSILQVSVSNLVALLSIIDKYIRYRRRNVMWVSCTRLPNRNRQRTKPRASKRFDEMVVQP